jgi:superfamily II DNA or RNA helicase
MSLKDLEIVSSYVGSGKRVTESFFNPCLSLATQYDRAVGYFTSGSILMLLDGFEGLIKNHGSARVIASPYLTREDAKAISDGAIIDDELVYASLTQELEILKALPKEEKKLSILEFLTRKNLLEFKIAYKSSYIYHEKIGIIHDDSDYVSFIGSGNETYGGLAANFERYEIFKSWDINDEKRAKDQRNHFEKLWNDELGDKDENLRVISFTQAVNQAVIQYRTFDDLGQFSLNFDSIAKPDEINKHVTDWSHQKEALEIFVEKKHGILEMATGTGKTRTSLNIAKHLLKNKLIDCVVIATKGNDLLQQWYKELIDQKLVTWLFNEYGTTHEAAEFINMVDDQEHSAIIISYDNLHKLFTTASIRTISNALLICDEIHNIGSTTRRKNLEGLLTSIPYRLGLSATPDREYDEDGNDFITKSIGDTIYKFGIKDAIRKGILCTFNYTPLRYDQTEDDKEKRRSHIKTYYAKIKSGIPVDIKSLYINLSRVQKTSEGKLPIFRDWLESNEEFLKRCVIFVDNKDYGEKIQHICSIFNDNYKCYYEGTSKEVLKEFSQGRFDYLIACHRISEGIDIQSVNSIILFSSAAGNLETIQRIGRCLRIDPNNKDKVAHVLDFVRNNCPTDANEVKLQRNNDIERMKWLSNIAQTKRNDKNE